MIGLLLTFLGFLASPFGLMALLAGFVTFLVLPIASRLPGDGKRGAGFMLWLAQMTAGRGAIVVSEAGETTFKSLSYNDQGVFEAEFADGKKLFEDVADSMHRLAGRPFGIVDEKHGVVFDPRFSAVGARKRESEEKEELHFKATSSEHSAYGVRGWVRGVFALPSKHELVDLTAVRSLVGGGERAEYGPKVERLYKYSREPYKSRKALLRLMVPVIGFLATFGGMWLIADQLGATGGGKTVTVSGLALFSSGVSVDRKRILKGVLAVGVLVAILSGLTALLGPLLTGLLTVTFAFGFLTPVVVTSVTLPSSKLSGGLSGIWFRLGLAGYKRPVFEWTPETYRVREYDDLEEPHKTNWYALAGSQVGFTFTPSVDSFAEGWTDDDVTANSEAATDGGPPSNIPPGYVRSEQLRRGPYGGFVPSRPDKDRIYVKSGRFLRRLAPAATGDKASKSLSHAREKYGLGWAAQMSDKTIAYMTFVLVILAALLGTWVFFL